MAYTTNYTMLEKMCRGDAISWQEFYLRYAPFVSGIARAQGFTPAEREEIVQLTMQTIFEKDSLRRYQKDLGQFRAYLSGIVKNQLRTFRRANPPPPAETLPQNDALENDMDSLFAREYRQYLFTLMLDSLRRQVENDTFEAFYLTAVEERSPEETARMLQIPVNRVYTAKSRCLRHLKAMAHEMQRDDPGFLMPFSES